MSRERICRRLLLAVHSFAQLILYPEGWQVQTPDPSSQGLGVFVDDAKTIVGGATASSTSFETDDITPWTVGGPLGYLGVSSP
jgi:hypothetical protein